MRKNILKRCCFSLLSSIRSLAHFLIFCYLIVHTNRYRMPLLHFAGATSCNTYFSSAFTFLSGEAEKNYVWAVKAYNRLVRHNIKLPNVVISDQCKALKNALSELLPSVPQILCRFHINDNIRHHMIEFFGLKNYVENSISQQKAEEVFN